MIITTEGIIIRILVADISVLGRNTSGVKLMNLAEKVSVASVAKVREESSTKSEEEVIKNLQKELGEDDLNLEFSDMEGYKPEDIEEPEDLDEFEELDETEELEELEKTEEPEE